MPHLMLEHSGNIREQVDVEGLFKELHAALSEVGGFRVQDFKSRAVRLHAFIGDGSYEQAFVNLDIRTFAGKPAEAKRRISQEALRVLGRHFHRTMSETSCDISVQITELNRESYSRSRSEDLEFQAPSLQESTAP
ncbi:5-carboxymethyl-2-hydroxymuconate Delta-isomerase [Streptomyces sp. NPDC020379]|uniref:5-carboxymethyl-2-hydroxymuconate Delta-isomerase n=1 Tax=Streptomyces sp. NPDC020379 TaxID=3365071 RepID=UPI0037B44C3D